MKKVFISQPMRGRTGEEILAERARVVQVVRDAVDEDIEVIDSFFQEVDTPVGANRPLYLLGRSLELLATADLVYFVSGWQYARGCSIEYTCATQYGISIMLEEAVECD